MDKKISLSDATPGRYELRYRNADGSVEQKRSVVVQHKHFWLVDPQVGFRCDLLDAQKCWLETPGPYYPEVFVLGRVSAELVSWIDIQSDKGDTAIDDQSLILNWLRSHWCLDVVLTSPLTLVVHHHSLYGYVVINLKRPFSIGDLNKEPNRG